jgi:photosystem II stability/assembly factor-like uncharacterized protein/spore coat protein CotH
MLSLYYFVPVNYAHYLKTYKMKTKILLIFLVVCSVSLFGQIPQYNVTMTSSNYNLLFTRDIFSDSTLPSSFEYQGTTWNSTQIRFKGHSTRYFPKKGYVVKFQSSNLFQSLGKATFNAMYTDKSFLREKLAWDLFNDMQEMSTRAQYGRLTINNEMKGLYLFVDKPDKYFLLNRGRVPGPMWEASDTYAMADLTVQPDTIIKLNYEQSIGTASDYTGLEAMIQSLNAASDSSFADTLSKYFDVQSVMNWFSGNIILMMGDSYVKSYFLYRDTTKSLQQWTTIPWDYDLSFGRNGEPTVPYPASLMNDDFAYTFPPLSGPSSVLKDRLWATPSLRELLRQRVDTILQTLFTEQKLYPKIDSLAAYIQHDVAADPDKWGTTQDFSEHIEALKYYITARKNFLNKTFIHPSGGLYNDVTLPVTQLNVPYHFVALDGRQLATLWFSSMSGLDSIRVQAYPDSTPPNIVNPAGGRYVRRWIQVTPYPSTATFRAKLQWSYKDVAANDREVGAGVQDEHLLRSYNYDGSSWQALSSLLNAFGNFVTIDSINESNCGAGKYFALLMSDTYTQTWFRAPLNYWHTWFDMKFFDSQNGFIIGDHGTVLRTTDAGASWSGDTIGFHLPFHGIAIPSMNNIFAAGESGAFYHTTDTARSWSRIDLGTTKDLLGTQFLSPQTGWTYGKNGIVYSTTNGGASWSLKVLDSTKTVYGIAAFSDSSYIAFLDGGIFSKTNDAGGTWQQGAIGAGQPISNIFTLGFSVWVVGDQGVVRFSVDSGASWSSIDVPLPVMLRNVYALDQSHVYVVGDGGKIFYTTDNGGNWYEQYSADSHDLMAVTFTDNTHGYAVGNNGTILTTLTSGTVTGVRPLSSHLPKEFKLYQNYPNPFNPKTDIRYQISDIGNVKLKIYDLLGREITTLVNEQLRPGVYTVSWDATSYASGIYFYRLDVTTASGIKKNYSEVNKMLLLK